VKKFEVICDPYGMQVLGVKWAKDSVRITDYEYLRKEGYSENDIYNIDDDFVDGFNYICKDEKGKYYAVVFASGSFDRPIVYREVEKDKDFEGISIIEFSSIRKYFANEENFIGAFRRLNENIKVKESFLDTLLSATNKAAEINGVSNTVNKSNIDKEL
jgi:hypothetical protein